MRPEGIDWRTPHPLSISQNLLIREDVATYPDAFVADEKRRRSGDQRLYLVLRLAAERARDRVLEHRVVRPGGRKRGPIGGHAIEPLRSWRIGYSNCHSRMPSRPAPNIRYGWLRRPSLSTHRARRAPWPSHRESRA